MRYNRLVITTDELEAKLTGGVETPTLEVKAACLWSAPLLAKDILAMSNVRDGGYIIIGVEDATFRRQGITPEQKASYHLDTMRDQMAKYADPRVVFTVEFPRDKNDFEFSVIRVLPFDEVPVICAVENDELRRGIVYYRNTNAKVESAPVSNANDMRDIMMTAAQRMMRRLQEAGFTVQEQANAEESTLQALLRERQGL